MTDRTKNAYGRWANSYDSDPNPQLVLEHDVVVGLVDAHPGDVILDAGCGTGRYVGEFLEAGAEVTGIDFSAAMLARAADAYPRARLVEHDLTRPLPFADATFDKVNCAQVLKHVEDLDPVFAEFRRVLRAEGRCVFSVTHPDMNWEGYEMAVDVPEVAVLSRSSDIFDHRFCDYFAACHDAGFEVDGVRQIPVTDAIRHLLTPASFAKVEGRYQVIAFRLRPSDAVRV